VRLLERARSLGQILILALNTDASVARLKGPSRPLIDENERARMALALATVDAVTYFDEDTPRELIAAVLPNILVKGADWAHFIAGREEWRQRRQGDGAGAGTGFPQPTSRRNCWPAVRKGRGPALISRDSSAVRDLFQSLSRDAALQELVGKLLRHEEPCCRSPG